MPQDTYSLPGDQTPKSKPVTSANAPGIPTYHTNIPHKSFNKLIPVVIILAILTLAGLGTSVFFGIQNANRGTEIANLKEQINKDQGSTIIIDDEEVPETPSEPSDQPTTVTKADVLAEVPKNLDLTNAKCLNCATNDMGYSISASGNFISARIDLSNNSASLTFNWDDIQRYYNISRDGKNGYETINDIQFSSPVTDVFVASYGQAVGSETILFLMSDGTVEYIPLYTAIKNSDFRSYGKLPELQDIVKFYFASAYRIGGTGGGMETLAQRADGSFYELHSILQATGNYDL